MRDPHEPRGRSNPQDERAAARRLKRVGIAADPRADRADAARELPLPRIDVTRPRKGFYHPAGKSDIIAVLRTFGAECTYGVRRVRLVRGEHSPSDGPIVLGRLRVPGTIDLFDQPASPWRFPGMIDADLAKRLREAGARVDISPDAVETVVDWPAATLRDFMLFDGLMHEIGHHRLQHDEGKRTPRAARTKDHEARAIQYARRCRAAHATGGSDPSCDP